MAGQVLYRHDFGCRPAIRSPFGFHSDAAKRQSDTYRLHRTAQGIDAIGQFFASALADGTTDGVLYESKSAAVRHQHHDEQWYAFVCIGPGDWTPCEAEEFLFLQRMLYDRNIRLTDPDHARGGRQVVQRSTVEDQRSLVGSIASRGRLRPSNLVYPGE